MSIVNRIKTKLKLFLVEAIRTAVDDTNQKQANVMEKSIHDGIKKFFNEDYQIINRMLQNSKTHTELARFMMEDFNPMYNPYILLKQKAAKESAEYIEQNMKEAMLIPMKTWGEKLKVLEHCLKYIPQNSFIVECGVYAGKSINFMADRFPAAQIYGFDSFEGLPEDWDGYFLEKGTFKTNIPEVRSNVTLFQGWFDQTLPKFAAEHKGKKIDLLHVDCDIYSSTVTIFENLHSLLGNGSVIVFDEYFNYPNWKEHEHKAFKEFCAKYNVRYKYVASGMQQVAVIIESIG
ncbi:hypothetical protein GCM10023310_54320 [Paenibacillus vulneris]|uniref:Class I SAM-dependent methyltransferase n=1 Tax=Paenibacillus vulneris TaxID=1133364 RepID=A0ABW3UYV6_9BACL